MCFLGLSCLSRVRKVIEILLVSVCSWVGLGVGLGFRVIVSGLVSYGLI